MHTKRCLAYALTCAIENMRDSEWADEEFDAWANPNDPRNPGNPYVAVMPNMYDTAVGYLNDGLCDCRCFPERGAFALTADEYDSMTEAGRVQFYTNLHEAAQKMVQKGWTEGNARDHLEGSCDKMYCGACNA